MRYFAVMDFQYWVLAFFLGLTSLILICLAWGSYPLHRKRESEAELEELGGHEIETGHDMQKNPIAPFLIFVYVIIVVWSLAYMIYIGILGTNI